MSLVLQFGLILKIGSIKCAYGGRQKNISRAPRWTGLLYTIESCLRPFPETVSAGELKGEDSSMGVRGTGSC
jgi:hypothetical protein